MAWEALVERYERLVYTVPLRQGMSTEEADDIFQLVWVSLLQHLNSLREPDRISAWLVTTAKRACWERQRRSGREIPHPLGNEQWALEEDPRDTPPESLVEEYEQQRRLRQALSDLEEPCRDLLRALYYDPSRPSYKQIAEKLDMAVGSIGPTRARCLEKLRQILEMM